MTVRWNGQIAIRQGAMERGGGELGHRFVRLLLQGAGRADRVRFVIIVAAAFFIFHKW